MKGSKKLFYSTYTTKHNDPKKCHPNEELLNTNPAYALMALNNTWEEITGKRRDPVLMCLLQGWYIALDGTPQHHHDPWCGDLTNYI